MEELTKNFPNKNKLKFQGDPKKWEDLSHLLGICFVFVACFFLGGMEWNR